MADAPDPLDDLVHRLVEDDENLAAARMDARRMRAFYDELTQGMPISASAAVALTETWWVDATPPGSEQVDDDDETDD